MKAIHLQHQNLVRIHFFAAELPQPGNLHSKIQFFEGLVHQSIGLDDPHFVVRRGGGTSQPTAHEHGVQVLHGGSSFVFPDEEGGVDIVDRLSVSVVNKGRSQAHDQGHQKVGPEIQELEYINHGTDAPLFLLPVDRNSFAVWSGCRRIGFH